MIIEATIGRVVLYHPKDHPEGVRHAATIAYVNQDGTVNLSISDCYGVMYSERGVALIQDGKTKLGECEWMAYQKGQAAKTEASEPAVSQYPATVKTILRPEDSVYSTDPIKMARINRAVDLAKLEDMNIRGREYMVDQKQEVVTGDDLAAKQDDELLESLAATESENIAVLPEITEAEPVKKPRNKSK